MKNLPVLGYVSLSLGRDKLKLGTLHVEIKVCCISHLNNVHFKSVVCPGTEFKLTNLVVKREVSDVDVAATAKYSWGVPRT